jgi:hypothetical protein
MAGAHVRTTGIQHRIVRTVYQLTSVSLVTCRAYMTVVVMAHVTLAWQGTVSACVLLAGRAHCVRSVRVGTGALRVLRACARPMENATTPLLGTVTVNVTLLSTGRHVVSVAKVSLDRSAARVRHV